MSVVVSTNGVYTLSAESAAAASYMVANQKKLLSNEHQNAKLRFAGTAGVDTRDMERLDTSGRVFYCKKEETVWMLVYSMGTDKCDPVTVEICMLGQEFSVPDNSWKDVATTLQTTDPMPLLNLDSESHQAPPLSEFIAQAEGTKVPQDAVNCVKYLLTHQKKLADMVCGVVLVASNIAKIYMPLRRALSTNCLDVIKSGSRRRAERKWDRWHCVTTKANCWQSCRAVDYAIQKGWRGTRCM